MYKKMIMAMSTILICGVVSINVYTNHNKIQSKDNVILEITASYDSIYDNANTTELEDRSDLILIGTVNAIDGVINYSEELDQYIMTSTIGRINVKNVIKGTVSENDEISFIRVGGTIQVSEYEKSLTPRQIIRQGLNQMTQQEKENTYVKFAYEDDIEIEEGKDYLIYLKYDQELSKYRIIGMEYGLKEYKMSTNQVRDNHAQNWETLQYNI